MNHSSQAPGAVFSSDAPASRGLRLWARATRWLLWLVVALWGLGLLTWVALNAVIVPRIDSWRPELQRWASDALGVPVTIADIRATNRPDTPFGLPPFMPAFELSGVRLLDAQGRMVTSSGYPLTAGITVPAEAQNITVSADGVVTAKMPGQAAPQQVGNIELANFINPAGLEPRGQNLFSESLASGNPITGAPGTAGMGNLMQGFVETSNVNVVQELVTMIQTQRAYEMNSKAIQTSDQMLQRLSQL